MKYAVIGQSNTLVKGNFVEHLRRFPQHQAVSVKRLGASYSIILPYFAADPSFFNGAQFCIIDTCVVDSGMVAGGTYSVERAESCLRWFGHQARQNGCEPIFLIIPTTAHIKDPDKRRSYFDMVHRVIRENGYLFLDVLDLGSRIAERLGMSIQNACYDDPWHLNEDTFRDIAAIIAWNMDTPPERGESQRLAWRGADFRVLNIQSSEVPEARHATSTISFDGVAIPNNTSIRVETGPATPVAAMVNVAGTFSSVRIAGLGETFVDCDIVPFSSKPFEARLVDIPTPILALDGQVEITPLPVERPKTRPTPPAKEGLEISDLLVAMEGGRLFDYEYSPMIGDIDLFQRFTAAGNDIAERNSGDRVLLLGKAVRDIAVEAGIKADFVGDANFGVARICPTPSQTLMVATPGGDFTGKIVARLSFGSNCSALRITLGDREPMVIPMVSDVRAFNFQGTGDHIEITSIPPGSNYVVDKITMQRARAK